MAVDERRALAEALVGPRRQIAARAPRRLRSCRRRRRGSLRRAAAGRVRQSGSSRSAPRDHQKPTDSAHRLAGYHVLRQGGQPMQTVTAAFVLTFLHNLAPGAEKYAQLPVVQAIVQATSAPEDAALLTTWALYESGVQVEPRGQSPDARKGVSCGPWQEPCAFVKNHTLTQQAVYWLGLKRQGETLCPASPLAPLSGGCKQARYLADTRYASAMQALAKTQEQLAKVGP